MKITMTGPYTLARVAYGGIIQVMQDPAKVIDQNFEELQEAGYNHIQVDEPCFSAMDRDEGEAINLWGSYSSATSSTRGTGSGTVTSTSAATRQA